MIRERLGLQLSARHKRRLPLLLAASIPFNRLRLFLAIARPNGRGIYATPHTDSSTLERARTKSAVGQRPNSFHLWRRPFARSSSGSHRVCPALLIDVGAVERDSALVWHQMSRASNNDELPRIAAANSADNNERNKFASARKMPLAPPANSWSLRPASRKGSLSL